MREELDTYNEQLFERSGERNGEVTRESAGGPEVERSVWQYFAVLPDVQQRGRHGRRAHVSATPIILRAVESERRDDRRLGEAAVRRAGDGSRSRIVAEVPGSEPGGLRRDLQAARDHRVGIAPGQHCKITCNDSARCTRCQ